jgi:hypothetical protein
VEPIAVLLADDTLIVRGWLSPARIAHVLRAE